MVCVVQYMYTRCTNKKCPLRPIAIIQQKPFVLSEILDIITVNQVMKNGLSIYKKRQSEGRYFVKNNQLCLFRWCYCNKLAVINKRFLYQSLFTNFSLFV